MPTLGNGSHTAARKHRVRIMRPQITLSRFLLDCGLAAAIIGVAATYLRHRQQNAALVPRIQAAGGSVEQERDSFLLLPLDRVVGIDLSGPSQPLDSALLRELSRVRSLRSL